MTDRAVWAMVPVKSFREAKRRLSPVLEPAERAQLAQLMLQDVLDALTACDRILAGVIVVTCDPQATAMAGRRGATPLSDTPAAGINAAVAIAIRYLAGVPNSGMIVVPADIPHLSPGAIEDAAAGISAPRAVVLVPATDDGGTNLLACAPAGAIVPGFGRDSFRRHCRAAHRAGIVPTILTRRDVGRDIDRPEDIAAFLSIGSATRTQAFLSERGAAERLRRWMRKRRRQPDQLSSAALEVWAEQ